MTSTSAPFASSRAALVALALFALPACGGTASGSPSGTTPASDAVTPHARSLTFNDTTFFLVYEANSRSGSIAEYVPRGQRPASWTELVAVRRFYQQTRPIDIAGAMHAQLEGRTPPRPSRLFVNEDRERVMLEFIDFEGEIFEPNIWRFEPSESGVIGYQYARRAYGMEAAQALSRDVQATMGEISGSFATARLPSPASPSSETFERFWTQDGTSATEVLAE